MSKIKLASRLSKVRVSPTVAISNRAKELRAAGRDIIPLSAGEPDFDTPKNIQNAATDAIARGETHYTMAEGIVELRQAVCNKFARDNKLDYLPDEIIVGAGGKQIIFNAMMATLEPDDEVIIQAPYWVSYPDIVLLFDAVPVIVESTEDNGFLMTPSQLEAVITSRTRWIFINSPCNPSGAVYSEKDFRALGEVLRSHPDVWIMSDDIYETIVFDGAKFVSFAEAVPELKGRTLTVNGLSKSHAMTGWRIGYGAGDKDLIKAMTKIQGQSTLHPCSVTQWAAVEALDGPQEILKEMTDTFDRRRRSTMRSLDAIDGLNCFPPQGAFYLFVSIAEQLGKTSRSGKQLDSDVDWVMALMEEQGVSVVPGSAFGTDGYFRLSFAAADEDLSQACERIKQFSKDLH